ncbi:TylF/MycF/NovP-related O-methyltransferase [Flavitalea sp. BT771]|uniref:TylF/MycF/NovP-related O-methyltransferase n=1 Tax=Flavitalea sp. BT771 TaxID=3063329 RepID=UPI0026E30B17|nr:TylF/MycF/NovP-related O-methyltransferase [Flavitalea sp. BT771]MDO6434788.1 TylF/MycF/NovP-related O-methyltransferase [Flavitalea sp. BT771]MDV6223688.1 TylF/MycF/NovP-related O-methyltransferase [Flavitalea sp. BT771]
MIELPDFKNAFDHENSFYLSCSNSRLSKFIAHYELFKLAQNLPGSIVECGVFMGNSLVRFAGFREILENAYSKNIIAFDCFEEFPPTNNREDEKYLDDFINKTGGNSISIEQLQTVLDHKNIRNVELIKGDINYTVPKYIADHPNLKISLINLDTDVYEPAVTILKHLYPKLVKGGVLLLDDYGIFPGETRAVDEFFSGLDVKIQKFRYAMTPSFIVKP